MTRIELEIDDDLAVKLSAYAGHVDNKRICRANAIWLATKSERISLVTKIAVLLHLGRGVSS